MILATGAEFAFETDLTGARGTRGSAFGLGAPYAVVDQRFPTIVEERSNWALVEEAMVELAVLGVGLNNPRVLRRFFVEHLELVGSAFSIAFEAMGLLEGSRLLLTVYDDPEISDTWLALVVRSATNRSTLLEALERLDMALQESLPRASAVFHVVTDFRQPSDAV